MAKNRRGNSRVVVRWFVHHITKKRVYPKNGQFISFVPKPKSKQP